MSEVNDETKLQQQTDLLGALSLTPNTAFDESLEKSPEKIRTNDVSNADVNLGEKKKIKITDLPDDIFRQIREFVSIDALLLQVNRRFHVIKGCWYYYKFIKYYSRKNGNY